MLICPQLFYYFAHDHISYAAKLIVSKKSKKRCSLYQLKSGSDRSNLEKQIYAKMLNFAWFRVDLRWKKSDLSLSGRSPEEYVRFKLLILAPFSQICFAVVQSLRKVSVIFARVFARLILTCDHVLSQVSLIPTQPAMQKCRGKENC